MKTARKVSCSFALAMFGTMAACSDPVTPAAQGSVSLYLTTVPSTIVGMCPPNPHWVNIPDAAGGQQSFSNRQGAVAVDGQNQMAVNCTVKDAGGGSFAVTASLKSPATNPSTGAMLFPTIVAFNTTISPSLSGQGEVDVQDDKTGGTMFVSTDDSGQRASTCTFSASPVAMTDRLAIAPGRIWASVSCPKFRDPKSSNVQEVCSIATGIIILENCQQ